jgi:hypothetical protein
MKKGFVVLCLSIDRRIDNGKGMFYNRVWVLPVIPKMPSFETASPVLPRAGSGGFIS